jgi:hypothetical protein
MNKSKIMKNKIMSSLDECVQHIHKHFPENKENTRYLYRGESGDYPHTHSSYKRLVDSKRFSQAELVWLKYAIQHVQKELSKAFSFSTHDIEDEITGLLQHYGLPTHFLDISSSLEVATYFGSDLTLGKSGQFCVVDIEKFKGKIIKLNNLEAQRPLKQCAYGLKLDENQDLKDKTTGVHWFKYEFSQSDYSKHKRFFQNKAQSINFLSTHYDEMAHFFAFYLCQFVAHNVRKNEFPKVVEYIEDITIELGLPSTGKIAVLYQKDGQRHFCEQYLRYLNNKPPSFKGPNIPPEVQESKFVDSWQSKKGLFIRIGMYVKYVELKSSGFLEKEGMIEKIELVPAEKLNSYQAHVYLKGDNSFFLEEDDGPGILEILSQ